MTCVTVPVLSPVLVSVIVYVKVSPPDTTVFEATFAMLTIGPVFFGLTVPSIGESSK